MIFPLEVWENIFLYSDPLTLINMRITCKCWKNIIDRILQVNNFNGKILVLLMELICIVCVCVSQRVCRTPTHACTRTHTHTHTYVHYLFLFVFI